MGNHIVYSIVGFLLATGILVTLHEWGHYAVARWCGVKVLKFSIGFGPTLYAWKSGLDQTEWKICALPLGGYVQFLTERDTTAPIPEEEKHRAYEQKKPWQRIAIVAAGPIVNLVTAIVVYTIVFSAGLEQDRARFAAPKANTLLAQAGVSDRFELAAWDGIPIRSMQDFQWHWFKRSGDGEQAHTFQLKNAAGVSKQVRVVLAKDERAAKNLGGEEHFPAWLKHVGLELDLPPLLPVIGKLIAGEPAMKAGLKEGDLLVSIDAKPIHTWQDVLDALRTRGDKTTEVVYSRQGRVHRVALVPVARPDAEGNPVGRIGIAPLFPKLDRADYHVLVQHPFPESLFRAVDKTVELSGMTLKAFYRMLTGSLSWKNVSGPVTMADVAGQSLQAGWVVYLNYLALISVSLGVMNLLPIPVLDGGHIVYESISWLRGNRPLDMKWLERGQQVGIAILGALMIVAFYNDVVRVLGDFAK